MRFPLAVFGLMLAAAGNAQPQKESEWAADEAILREQKLPTKGPELLQTLRDRIPSETVIQQFKSHVARLKSSSYGERVNATTSLIKMGPVVRPLLENLLSNGKVDLETLRRVRLVIDEFPVDKDHAAVQAAARIIQRDKPAEALQILLDFVPYVTHEPVRQEIQRAINATSFVEGKPTPLIEKAMKDDNGPRRAAAAEATIRSMGVVAAKDQIETLLKDQHLQVRYQVGVALVEKHDKKGLPLLIEALSEVTPDQAMTIIELLDRAAGDNAPAEYYQGKHSAAKVSKAWDKWLAANGPGLDLAKQFNRPDLGFTVIATTGINVNIKHKIAEFGAAPERAVRWEFDGPRNAVDFQILGPNRLLIAEYVDRRVTERDFKGNIIKQFSINLPIACQRLPNGHTFIATRQQLMIVDAEGRQIFTHSPTPAIIAAAHRLKNGQFLIVQSGGRCQLLDAEGKELKAFSAGGNVYPIGGTVELLANGRVLLPLYSQNQIAEFDWTGKKHWMVNMNRPTSATRLADGHTLVTCLLESRVVEVDENGAEVWSMKTEGRPYRARRR